MVPKGKKIPNRRPQENRTRSDGIDLDLQHQIILDIEIWGADKGPTHIVDRRSIYGEKDSELHKKVHRKARTYLTLKQENSDAHWQVGAFFEYFVLS